MDNTNRPTTSIFWKRPTEDTLKRLRERDNTYTAAINSGHKYPNGYGTTRELGKTYTFTFVL